MENVIKTESGFYVSLYTDSAPTAVDHEVARKRLAIAFPRMREGFFLMLTEFVIMKNFTAKQLTDAVNHAIANVSRKELSISDVIKFDCRAKLYTYNEAFRIIAKGEACWPDFEIRKVNGKVFRVNKMDLL